MQESDWKIFKKVKEAALDKCCEKSLAEFQQLISDNSKSNHQRFLDLFDRVDNANSEIARMFDGHSRSRAAMQALAMRKHGLIPHESMTNFSQEFQEQTNPEKYE